MGTQAEGFNLSASDKVRIARKLDELGVAFIERRLAWLPTPKMPSSSSAPATWEWKHALIAAFSATCRVKGGPEDDANIKALLDLRAPVCTIFGKSWTLHVKEVLLTTLEDNLRIIEQSVAYLRASNRRVIYDAEHFFDGYKADPAYALETLRAAIRGGAEMVVLCDTNGGTMPWEVEQIIREMKASIQHPFGIHAHNDGDAAVVNSLVSVREWRCAGAGHHQRRGRALRQRQPDFNHRRPGTQDGLSVPAGRSPGETHRPFALCG